MENQHQVHNLIILDESGSMESIKKPIITGFNELVQTMQGIEKQFPEQQHLISMVSFNGLGTKLMHLIDPVSKLQQIHSENYQPNASTPLYDAIGFAVNKLRQILQGKTHYNVLVSILTDGEENASKEYSQATIKALIEELKTQNWTFTYMGTDHDVEAVAQSLSIPNQMSFAKDTAGIQQMMAKEKKSRMRYSSKLSSKEEVGNDYYQED